MCKSFLIDCHVNHRFLLKNRKIIVAYYDYGKSALFDLDSRVYKLQNKVVYDKPIKAAQSNFETIYLFLIHSSHNLFHLQAFFLQLCAYFCEVILL